MHVRVCAARFGISFQVWQYFCSCSWFFLFLAHILPSVFVCNKGHLKWALPCTWRSRRRPWLCSSSPCCSHEAELQDAKQRIASFEMVVETLSRDIVNLTGELASKYVPSPCCPSCPSAPITYCFRMRVSFSNLFQWCNLDWHALIRFVNYVSADFIHSCDASWPNIWLFARSGALGWDVGDEEWPPIMRENMMLIFQTYNLNTSNNCVAKSIVQLSVPRPTVTSRIRAS